MRPVTLPRIVLPEMPQETAHILHFSEDRQTATLASGSIGSLSGLVITQVLGWNAGHAGDESEDRARSVHRIARWTTRDEPFRKPGSVGLRRHYTLRGH